MNAYEQFDARQRERALGAATWRPLLCRLGLHRWRADAPIINQPAMVVCACGRCGASRLRRLERR